MTLLRLSMGCLSSRSTIVPSERVENTGQKSKFPTKQPQQTTTTTTTNNDKQSGKERTLNGDIRSNDLNSRGDNNYNSNATPDHNKRQQSVNSGSEEDDIMSMLMNQGRDKSIREQDGDGGGGGEDDDDEGGGGGQMMRPDDAYKDLRPGRPVSLAGPGGDRGPLEMESTNHSIDGDMQMRKSNADGSFDEEPNQELLRQYVAIDYEITLLEDKDALRVYHEKIEQLEELERELDMIGTETEEVASRSETGTQLEMDPNVNGPGGGGGGNSGESKMDMENNSIISGATGSVSRKSWMPNNNLPADNNINNQRGNINNNNAGKNNSSRMSEHLGSRHGSKKNSSATVGSRILGSNRNSTNLPYSTVEEVFNKKIILEKERDKLKKEVETVIIECDKLQQRYKKRDEILDKLFDGRTGNGLENHLEQQLNWLLEQKHYVDQVFYAWKRAESLNSQTCEQFTSALELVKRLPKVEDDPDQRSEIIKGIVDLLIKSSKDIKQAQQYNPNVDAPFFTDNETERFNTIVELISSSSFGPSDYGQVQSVIQFAYKRAVNIRLWLEQILQTTIARDSFELAEEYKWIAIQLRKERINLIKSKLQSPSSQPMVQSIQEQIARQQSIEERRQAEINRDSGIESESNDFEEEIYRLLEMNRSRLEMATSGNNNNNPSGASAPGIQRGGRGAPMNGDHNARPAIRSSDQQLRVAGQNIPPLPSASSSNESDKDKKMRQRIQKRVKGDQPLLTAKVPSVMPAPGGASPSIASHHQQHQHHNQQHNQHHHQKQPEGQSNDASQPIGTPTRLKIELDEEAKQSLLKQVDQIHRQHKSRIEKLRGNNRAKAANSIMNRMQQLRENQTGREQLPVEMEGAE